MRAKKSLQKLMLFGAALALSVTALVQPAFAGDLPGLVSEQRANWTPSIETGTWDDGINQQVWNLEPADGNMFACGKFDRVYEAGSAGGRTLTRNSVFSFDAGGANKGRVSNFAPNVTWRGQTGIVRDCVQGYDANTLLLVGRFDRVNGQAVQNIAMVNRTTGALINDFNAKANAEVSDVIRAKGRYFIFGAFTKVNGGWSQTAIATLKKDGNFSKYFRSNIRGVYKENIGVTQSYRGAIKPGAKELVAIVKSTKIDGVKHHQLAKWDLKSNKAVLQNWDTKLTDKRCGSDMAVRDVEYDPRGKFFYTVSTGGDAINSLCDRVVKFASNDRGKNVKPKFVLRTCWDTSHSLAVTTAGMYVQGHMKCVAKFPGAERGNDYKRAGIFAMRRVSGEVRSDWRSDQPRCVGGKVLTVTSPSWNQYEPGLWSGLDCDPGIIFRPLN